jgi:arabinose-5-phosphate isomerase
MREPKRISEETYFAQVANLLRIESEAIAQTAARLDGASVDEAIKLLIACKGKVIVSGAGKSGHIAQKIAATMTSTGTAAVYLHPADALHGDLGIVTSEDVMIALSNSGETYELVEMLPFLKHRSTPIIALVGNLRSTLARRADVALDASVSHEACPLNLAPTTSTTVALALGDALAMTLMQVKGWTLDDFALNHPAGSLGKRLTLTVGDLMHAGVDNPTVREDAAWFDVIAAITKGGLGAVNVTDDAGHLVGIITDGDLRRALQKIKPADLESLSSQTLMTGRPVVASPKLLAYDALRLMEDRPSQISVLPVVDRENFCVGLIRLHDIVRSGLA